jgi:hypothetical protein
MLAHGEKGTCAERKALGMADQSADREMYVTMLLLIACSQWKLHMFTKQAW